MIKKSILIHIFFLILFGPIVHVYAGGGRYSLQSYNSPGWTGTSGINIQAWITNQGQSSMSVGEKAEFRIQSPRTGDRCNTTTGVTTNFGQIFGVCYADQAGQLLVYVHSFDRNEDSSPYVLYFNNKPTPTRTNLSLPTIQPSPTKQPLLITGENQIFPTSIPTSTMEQTVNPTPQVVQIQNKNFGQFIIDYFIHIFSKLFPG